MGSSSSSTWSNLRGAIWVPSHLNKASPEQNGAAAKLSSFNTSLEISMCLTRASWEIMCTFILMKRLFLADTLTRHYKNFLVRLIFITEISRLDIHLVPYWKAVSWSSTIPLHGNHFIWRKELYSDSHPFKAPCDGKIAHTCTSLAVAASWLGVLQHSLCTTV